MPATQPQSPASSEAGQPESHTGDPRQPAFLVQEPAIKLPSPPSEGAVRVSTGSAGEQTKLAFVARLAPIAGVDEPTGAPRVPLAGPETATVSDAAGTPESAESFDQAVAALKAPSEGAADHGQGDAATAGQDSTDGEPQPSRKTETLQSIVGELPQAAMGGVMAQAGYSPEPRADNAGGAAPAESARPKEGPALPPGYDPAKTPGAARDIRLEVSAGDQRVEVRLTERAGEVHVAVRTPDGHLAGALREDLPALSSRLNESGFRAETWHPGASGDTEWQQNGREHQHGQQPPPQPRVPQEQPNHTEKGKDFKWFMSTLR
jgi:hypothetical protein